MQLKQSTHWTSGSIMTRRSIPALSTEAHNSEVNPVVKKKKKKHAGGAATLVTPSAATGATPSAATGAATGATPSTATGATLSAATGAMPSAATGATPSAATAAEPESRIKELGKKLFDALNARTQALTQALKEEQDARMNGDNALLQQLNTLQNDVREMEPIVVRIHRRIILDEAREKMHAQNPFTREYRPGWNMRELLSKVKQNDPDARQLSEPSLRMILDSNHRIRRLANDVAHNASDAEKSFAVDSDVDLSRAMRTDLKHVYDYTYLPSASNGTSA